MTADPARAAASSAARIAIDDYESNYLVREHLWRIVTTALDAYEYEMELAALTVPRARPAWCVLHPDGRPWLIVPTRRMAKAQRKTLAALSHEHPRMLRIVRVETVVR